MNLLPRSWGGFSKKKRLGDPKPIKKKKNLILIPNSKLNPATFGFVSSSHPHSKSRRFVDVRWVKFRVRVRGEGEF